jgi:hypothetical protein
MGEDVDHIPRPRQSAELHPEARGEGARAGTRGERGLPQAAEEGVPAPSGEEDRAFLPSPGGKDDGHELDDLLASLAGLAWEVVGDAAGEGGAASAKRAFAAAWPLGRAHQGTQLHEGLGPVPRVSLVDGGERLGGGADA